jgi:hypothetical protein
MHDTGTLEAVQLALDVVLREPDGRRESAGI